MTPTDNPPPTLSKFVIRWETRDAEAIAKIRQRFNIPSYTTLNGWSPCEIRPEDIPVFQETARRGFFSVVRHSWEFKNGFYSW